MRALTVQPGQPNSLRLNEVAAAPESDGAVKVRALALGIVRRPDDIKVGLEIGEAM